MKSVNTLTLASLLIVTPALALAQKPGKPVPPPHTLKVHPAVSHNVVKNDAAKDAAKDAARDAERTADKAARDAKRAARHGCGCN